MRGLRKSKRLSWAPDVNLCQVRLFLSEDSPSQVGLGAQDHLQAKISWLSHPSGTATDDFLPPGFEGGHPANQVQIKVSDIPVIRWRFPPRVVLNITWQVVAGEESKEVDVQIQREMRVLEAVYPRPSAIPPNPTFTVDTIGLQNDDQIFLIPMTPIEDEDVVDAQTDCTGTSKVPMSSQAQPLTPGIRTHQCSISNIQNTLVNEKPTTGVPLGIETDTMAAAFAAINGSNEDGNLIDHDLLIKILRNPKLIETLVTGYGAISNAQNLPKPTTTFAPVSDPPFPPVTLSDTTHLHLSRAESNTQSSTATSFGQLYNQPNGIRLGFHSNARVPPPGVLVSSVPSIAAPQAKDLNYYKNLIQQHGGERQESPQQFGIRYNHQLGSNQELGNPKSREPKHKIMKPCIYYNSSRGCRNGANCAYQHDASSQQRASNISEVQSSKRTKMYREINS